MRKITILSLLALTVSLGTGCGKEAPPVGPPENASAPDTLSHPTLARFEGSCFDAIEDLKELFRLALPCRAEFECSFLDSQFLPLDPTHTDVRLIDVDECTFIPQLIVANTFKAVKLQRDLLLQRQRVREACGFAIFKPNCNSHRKFDPFLIPPHCRAGRCETTLFKPELPL